MKNVVAILAVAGLATVANAQATFDLNTQWALGHTASPGAIAGNLIEVTPGGPGQYAITLQGGMFNFQANGQQVAGQLAVNAGLQSLLGNLTVAGGGAALSIGSAPRVTPFGFGPGNPLNGTVVGGNINNFDANFTLQTVFWPWQNPTRPAAQTRGVNSYANVYRFFIDISDVNTPRDIVVSYAGQGETAFGWGIISENLPDVDGEIDGSVQYGVLASGFRPTANTLTIRIIPAPGAAALLGMGGLLVARRRRA